RLRARASRAAAAVPAARRADLVAPLRILSDDGGTRDKGRGTRDQGLGTRDQGRGTMSPADAFDRRNLVTYASLLCGVAALEAAWSGHARTALGLVALAVVADTLDGRFARLFGDDPWRKALGVQLDSLADAIAFGIAPVVAAGSAFDAAHAGHGVLWILAAFGYAASAITRLGFYNVSPDAERGSGF